MLRRVRGPSSIVTACSGQLPSASRRQQVGADRGAVDDQDFLHRWDGGVGPDIGPGLGLIAGREDFDQQDRVGEGRFLLLVVRTGHGQVRNSEIAVGADAGDDAGCRDHRAGAAACVQVGVDQAAQSCLDTSVRPAGRRHGARLSVQELPGRTRGRIPGEEFLHGHDGRYAERGFHLGLVARFWAWGDLVGQESHLTTQTQTAHCPGTPPAAPPHSTVS